MAGKDRQKKNGKKRTNNWRFFKFERDLVVFRKIIMCFNVFCKTKDEVDEFELSVLP